MRQELRLLGILDTLCDKITSFMYPRGAGGARYLPPGQFPCHRLRCKDSHHNVTLPKSSEAEMGAVMTCRWLKTVGGAFSYAR